MKILNLLGVALAIGTGGLLTYAANVTNQPSPTAAYDRQLALAEDCNVGPGSPEPQCCPSGYCEDS